MLSTMTDIMTKKRETFRAKAYQKAYESVAGLTWDVRGTEEDMSRLAALPGVGATILVKLREFIAAGTLQVIEEERNNPVTVISEVYGIGPEKAKKLVAAGITSIAELQQYAAQQPGEFNKSQLAGLRHHADIIQRIPRAEIAVYEQLFQEVVQNVIRASNVRLQIVGSYRRGAATSGDIDVIITSSDASVYAKFLDELLRRGIIIEVLSRGNTKCLVITRLGGGGATARRVDFLFTPPEEYAYAILYFTGSKLFNIAMRNHILEMGYTINEHRMIPVGGGVEISAATEEDIFRFVGLEYRAPGDRVDGRSVSVVRRCAPPLGAPEVANVIQNFRAGGVKQLRKVPAKIISQVITTADDAYHNTENPLLTDGEYDVIRGYADANVAGVAGKVGAPVTDGDDVVLPFVMPSLDKIGDVGKWLQREIGRCGGEHLRDMDIVVSCKLDGCSILYDAREGGALALYTRGGGIYGKDVSACLRYLSPHMFPKIYNVVIRGELILSRKSFAAIRELTGDKYSSSRNAVVGIMKKICGCVKDGVPLPKDVAACVPMVEFVGYELVYPTMHPVTQMTTLSAMFTASGGGAGAGGGVVPHVIATVAEASDPNWNSRVLLNWREQGKYDMDGIVMWLNVECPAVEGQAVVGAGVGAGKVSMLKHKIAFKLATADQRAETRVLDVIWTPSRYGYAKPRIQVEPVTISGCEFNYATGNNARFIVDNKIGPGAVVVLARNKDVIPGIVEVLSPAGCGLLPPDGTYSWTSTGADIVISGDIAADPDVITKRIVHFFTTIGVEGLKAATARKFVDAGYVSVADIVGLSADEIAAVPGIGKGNAVTLHGRIRGCITSATPVQLMIGSQAFGRGLGSKLGDILSTFPDVFCGRGRGRGVTVAEIASIDGIGEGTAAQFIEGIPAFKEFVCDIGRRDVVASVASVAASAASAAGVVGGKLAGVHVVVTGGFADKSLKSVIESAGGIIEKSVTRAATVLISKNKGSTKDAEAERKGVPIMTEEEFKLKYGL